MNKTINIEFQNNNLLQCLKLIEQKSKVNFSYVSSIVKAEEKIISKGFENQNIGLILKTIFENTILEFKEIGNQITIYKRRKKGLKVVSLSGYILAENSNEKLIGARIYIPSIEEGCISNTYGYYHMEIPLGLREVIINSLGMKTLKKTISCSSDFMLNFELEEQKIVLQTVEVNSENKDSMDIEIGKMSNLSKTIIDSKSVIELTSSNGSPDITKYAQQFAGVQPTQDGASSFKVRGLSGGNNLILLDEIPIYHPTHLLGIYSIINSSAVKSASFYKDYMPAKFGTRNSSVLQIFTKEGNLNKFEVSGGLGANVPHIDVQGPIIKGKLSFYTSLRKSFNPLKRIKFEAATKLPNPDFYDLTLKLNYKIDYQNRIYFTSYIGNDKIEFLDNSYDWGNSAFSFRWNKVISDKKFANLTVVNSIFKYKTFKSIDDFFPSGDTSLISIGSTTLNFGQKVISNEIKYNITEYISNTERLDYGVFGLNTRTKNTNETDEANLIFLDRNAIEFGVFAIWKNTITERLKVEVGVRIPNNFHIGTGDSTRFLKPDNSAVDVFYKKGRAYDFKLSIDPRLIGFYRLNKNNEVQFSANVATQFIHTINYNTNILPLEIWTTSSKYLKPERNYQGSIGLVNLQKNFKSSGTVFYRFVNNIIDYAPAFYSPNKSIESNLLSGHLNAFGTEVMVKYESHKAYSNTLSYSYTYAKQNVKGINNNLSYAPDFHRPHYFSFNQFYNEASGKWKYGANFIIHSKTKITLPNGKVEINGVEFPIYDGTKNASELPYYHRLDLSVRRKLGLPGKKHSGYLMITMTNIYNRKNISNAFLSTQPFDGNQLKITEQNYVPRSIFIYFFIKL